MFGGAYVRDVSTRELLSRLVSHFLVSRKLYFLTRKAPFEKHQKKEATRRRKSASPSRSTHIHTHRERERERERENERERTRERERENASRKRGESMVEGHHVRRSSSLANIKQMANHFPKHVREQAAKQDFKREAMQYALWIPFGLLCLHFEYEKMANLFFTWFILGELMLIFMHVDRKFSNALKWYNVLLFVVPVAVYFIKELMIPENSFYMFFVEYVIFGTLAFAIVIPFIPKHLLRGFDWYPMIKKMGFKT